MRLMSSSSLVAVAEVILGITPGPVVELVDRSRSAK
jgi:hypothetical protein